MAKGQDERLKKVVGGVPYIGCSDCRKTIKFGYMNEDVMYSPERITKEDWQGITPMYCQECLEKRK